MSVLRLAVQLVLILILVQLFFPDLSASLVAVLQSFLSILGDVLAQARTALAR